MSVLEKCFSAGVISFVEQCERNSFNFKVFVRLQRPFPVRRSFSPACFFFSSSRTFLFFCCSD